MSRPSEDSFARGAVLTTGAQAVGLIASGLAGLAIARGMGPAGAGVCAVALTSYALLLTSANLGIGLGTAWQVGGGRWNARSAVLSTQLSAAVLGPAAAVCGLAALALAGTSLTRGISAPAAVALVGSIPFALVWTNAANVAVAAARYRIGLLLPALQSGLYLAGIVLFAGAASVQAVLWALLASNVVTAAVSVWWGVCLRPRAVGRSVDVARVRQALAFGIQPWAGRMLTLVVQRGDLMVLGATASRAEVGYYAVAVAVTGPLWVLPTGIAAVLLPRTAALDAADRDGALELIESRSLRHATVMLVIAACGLAVIAWLALEPLYGRAFEASTIPALVLLPGTIAAGIAQVMRSALAGRGEPRAVLVTWAGTLPIAAALYVLLIPPYGATGAALASTVAYGCASVLGGRLLARASGLPTLPRLRPGRTELLDYRRALARRRRRQSRPPGPA
jgi:O-antigen/teichoic acid export membrane protein